MRAFLIGLLKFLFIVILMMLLYPILGVVTYAPIVSLCQFLQAGSLSGVILMHGIHVLSILIVCFLAGLLFPSDRWIVRPAAIVSLLWDFVSDIITGIHASREVPRFPLSSFVLHSIIPFIFMILLVYWLTDILHRSGQKLRR